MAAANEMKAILLEILEQAFQPADVTATQQMGVQMSNAVKRDGVVIIQNQNVEVYARIMPAMVRALRLCDSFEPVVEIAHEPLQIAQQQPRINADVDDDDADAIEKVCRWFFYNECKWEAARETFKDRYISYVVNHFKTKREAAEFLGVNPTYLSKLTAQKEITE